MSVNLISSLMIAQISSLNLRATLGFIITLLATLAAGEPRERCRNAVGDGGPGFCVVAESCTAVARDGPDNKQLLQDSYCNDDDKSFLCCPASSIVEGNQRPRLNSGEAPDGPPMAFDHPKLRLLPIALCGDYFFFRGPHDPHQFLFHVETLPTVVRLIYTTPRREERFLCGGSLISSRYVLTSAQCIIGLRPGFRLSGVVLGDYNVTSDPDCKTLPDSQVMCRPKVHRLGIERIKVHPEYIPRERSPDLALIRLDKSVDFKAWDLIPACLPIGQIQFVELKNLENDNLIAMGWGTDLSRGPYTEELRTGALEAVDGENCKRQVGSSTSLACVSGKQYEDNKIADLGGPLNVLEAYIPHRSRERNGLRLVQVALLTAHSRPLLFTQIGPYIPWILDTIEA